MCSLTSCLNLIYPTLLTSCVHINLLSIFTHVNEKSLASGEGSFCYACRCVVISSVMLGIVFVLLSVVVSCANHYIRFLFLCTYPVLIEWYKTVQWCTREAVWKPTDGGEMLTRPHSLSCCNHANVAVQKQRANSLLVWCSLNCRPMSSTVIHI